MKKRAGARGPAFRAQNNDEETGGEMPRLVREHDWASTPLGPRARWPQSLKTAVDLVLGCQFPMLVLWGPALVQIYNDAYRALMGSKHPMSLGQPVYDCWPETRHAVEPIYRRVLQGESIALQDAPFPIVRHGELEHASFTLSYSPLRDDGGAVAGVLVVGIETTARRDLEAERLRSQEVLRASEARYRAFVHGTSSSLFRMSACGRRLLEVSGGPFQKYPHGAATSESWFEDYAHPEDRALIADTWRKAVQTGTVYELTHRGRRTDGTWGWVLSRAVPVRDGGGEVIEWVGTATDVTERKTAEIAIEKERERILEREKIARIEAERAMTMKDEFLAVVSHELRTPLSAILLWAKLLRAGTVPEEQQSLALETIEQSAEAQRQLIDDLLDVSGMLLGKLRVDVREVELGPVVSAAVDAVRPMAEARGVDVEVAIDERAGRGRVDPDRMQQVIWNLLNNAVKFTDKGGSVHVSLRRLGASVRIRVADTGRGIRREFMSHLFERFRQADASSTRAQGGLGLGLAISKQLVELHGGTIRAESAGEGRGSTFTVDLPVSDMRSERALGKGGADGQPSAPPSLVASPVLEGLRVLLVEDDTNTRKVVEWLLKQCEAEVTAVASAQGALDAFRTALMQRPFDVLISDIGLPSMDGYELLRQVRSLERQSGAVAIPAGALTAYARTEDRITAAQAGYQTHVAKPVDPDALVAAVAGLAGRDTQELPPWR